MNEPENKRMLWDLTNHLYKSWMSREQVIALFEQTITEFDHGIEPLMQKNKRFLSVYVERVEAIQPVDPVQRAAMFEERLKTRHNHPVPKKTVSFEPEIIEIVAPPEEKTNINLCLQEISFLKEEVRLLKEKVILLERK